MSSEEKENATRDLIKDLDEHKEMHALSQQNVCINAFHDVRATLASVEDQVRTGFDFVRRNFLTSCAKLRRLTVRTGCHVAMISSRHKFDSFVTPGHFASTETVHQFFQLCFNITMDELVQRFEAFCLAGVQGTSALY